MTKIYLLVGLLFFLTLESKAERIVYVGDSLSLNSSGFGPAIREKLIEMRHQVEFHSLCGASPSTWLSARPSSTCGYWQKNSDGKERIVPFRKSAIAPSFPSLMRDHEPDRVIIQLGTNMLTGDGFKSARTLEGRIEKILDAVGQKKCTWIGPPDARDDKISPRQREEFYKALYAVARGRCEVIDSRFSSPGKRFYYPEGRGDGLHFSGLASVERLWVSRVKNELESKLTGKYLAEDGPGH